MYILFKLEILLLGFFSNIQIFAKNLYIRMSIAMSFKCGKVKNSLSIQQDRIMVSTCHDILGRYFLKYC